MSAQLFPSFIQGLRSLAALPSCYVRAGQRSLRTSPAFQELRSLAALPPGATKAFAFYRQMAAHTGAPQPALGSRVARLAAKHAAINPPNQRRILNYPICG